MSSFALAAASWQRRVRTMGALARKSKCAAWGKRIAVTRRADAIYCSAACRQRGHRARRAAAAAKPRKAHQRLIKERHEVGVFVLPPGFDTAIVRPVPKAVAIEIIERYESMPAIAHFYFGLFFGESCEGAVVYGPEYGENLGVWDKDNFSGKIITLLRGATPTSSTSSQRQFAHPPLDGVVAQALAIESGKVVTTFDC